MQLQPGTPIGGGKYTLIEQIGEGGQSEVWRAQQHGLEGFSKDVVLKFILPDQPTGQLRDMLVQEARLVVRLTHPNIVQIFDIAQEGERLYLAMEHIKGGDLGGLLAQYQHQHASPLPWPLAVAIMAQVCDGLHHAHTLTDDNGQPLGIIHRDLKPENILLSEDGFLKLIDFGIAKFSSSTKTKTGSLKGTPAYMSPEQITARHLDHRSDLFPIGSILYELCCGERPFEAPDVFTLLFVINQQEPTPLAERMPGLPQTLLDLIQQLMSKSPDQRPQDARQVRQSLRAILTQHGYVIEREELATIAQTLGRGEALPADLSDWREASAAVAADAELAPSDTVPNPPTEAVLEQLAAIKAGQRQSTQLYADDQPQPSPYEHHNALPSGQQLPEDEGFVDGTQASSLRYPETTLQPTTPWQSEHPITAQETAFPPHRMPSGPQAKPPGFHHQTNASSAGAPTPEERPPAGPYPAASPVPSGTLEPDILDETLQTKPPKKGNLWLAALTILLLCAAGVGLLVHGSRRSLTTSQPKQPPNTNTSRPQPSGAIPSLPPLATKATMPHDPPRAGGSIGQRATAPTLSPAPVSRRAKAPPARRKRRRRRRKRYGQLRLEIEPKCKVYEGSHWLGHSNGLVLRRSYGRFHFRCVCVSCRFQRTFSVRIRRRHQIFRRRYRIGKLFLSSRPWSTIHLDPFGKIGYTQQYLELYEGRYTFTLRKQGKSSQTKRISVILRPGRVTRGRPILW